MEVKTNRTNTNKINKTWSLLQTNGGKDEQNMNLWILTYSKCNVHIYSLNFQFCGLKRSMKCTKNDISRLISILFFLLQYKVPMIIKGNIKITELRRILQRESQNSSLYKQTKTVNNRKTVKTVITLTWYRHF